jgi:hypothetical protein
VPRETRATKGERREVAVSDSVAFVIAFFRRPAILPWVDGFSLSWRRDGRHQLELAIQTTITL